MNKTKAKELINILDQVDALIGLVERELNFENLLSYVYDYTGITIGELKRRYDIK